MEIYFQVEVSVGIYFDKNGKISLFFTKSFTALTDSQIGLIARDSPHVLVALTRHTKAMVYYTVVFDAVTSIIADVEKVDQSILAMFATTVPTK